MMSNPVFCPECAKATLSGAAYCQHCGHDLSKHAINSAVAIDTMETAESVTQHLSAAEFVFYLWLTSLAALGLASAVYKIYNLLDLLLVALLFVAYIWVFLLVRLDQLASAIGKNPVSSVYSSLLLPLAGNFISYYALRQSAQLRIRELSSLST